MKVNFICVGVQKGGTGSLIKYLNIHPDIYMKEGESHFFDQPLINGDLTKQNIKKYEKKFKKKKIIGEKTPSYCYLRYSMDRIYNYNKNIKLIIMLREPISRAFSQYNMRLNIIHKKTLYDVTDEEIMNTIKEEENITLDNIKSNGIFYIQRGFYDEILEYILSKFPRKNVYIGISEEINENKLKYYNEIYKFLGTHKLKNLNNITNVDERVYKKTIPKNLEYYLYDIYKSHNEKLYKLLGRKITIWENYYNKLKEEKLNSF